ncbi:hypothetical protein ZWY2020_015354 [Hordeum vulgare]|nr:hypothetical protein ZWY2020_015354 [Hordeum vulgare]
MNPASKQASRRCCGLTDGHCLAAVLPHARAAAGLSVWPLARAQEPASPGWHPPRAPLGAPQESIVNGIAGRRGRCSPCALRRWFLRAPLWSRRGKRDDRARRLV